MVTKRVQPCRSDKAERLGELPGMHGRGADIAGLPGFDDVMQRFESLFERCVIVEAMDLVKIDIVHAEPLETGIDRVQNRFARQAGDIGTGFVGKEHFGRDDHFVPPREVLQGTPDDLFARAGRIAVGGVEEIDPELQRLADERPAFFLRKRPFVLAAIGIAIAHAAEADARDIEAGAAEFHIIHGKGP